MKITMILADAAQEVQGKLYILGGGWTVTSSPTAPHGIAIRVDVPWDRTNVQHDWSLVLLDGDGSTVAVPGPAEEPQDVRIDGNLEVGRPPRVPSGTPINAALAFSLPPLPLQPGRYEWRFEIDGTSQTCGFTCIAGFD